MPNVGCRGGFVSRLSIYNRCLAQAPLHGTIRMVMRLILISLLSAVLCSFGQASPPPSWAAEAVWYQIFPERFCSGDENNNPTRDSLELPVSPEPSWRVSRWTADWYSRDNWEKQRGPDFYKDGVFDRRYGGDLQGVINRLAQFQIDSINIVARAHFLPVFSRLGAYPPALLERAAHQPPRRLFEYWGHAASLIDVRLQPLLRFRMATRGRPWQIAAEHPELLDKVRQHVAERGPISARDIEHEEERVRTHWGWNW